MESFAFVVCVLRVWKITKTINNIQRLVVPCPLELFHSIFVITTAINLIGKIGFLFTCLTVAFVCDNILINYLLSCLQICIILLIIFVLFGNLVPSNRRFRITSNTLVSKLL